MDVSEYRNSGINNIIKIFVMKLFEYLDRINMMHRMILSNRTGTHEAFAHQMRVSRTTLYEIIDELRPRVGPILYSKTLKTFYYKVPFEILVNCSLRPLTNQEEKNLSGGIFSDKILFFRTLLQLFSS